MRMRFKQKIKKLLPWRLLSGWQQYRCTPYPMNLTAQQREEALKKLYFEKTGKTIDFDNVETFNEKIQWMKLYWDHPDLSRIVCKYRFKQYIAEKLGEGYTIPLLGAWKSVEDIDWESLPESFVLKSNASSDGRGIKFIRGKSKYDFEEIKNEIAQWLDPQKTLINSFCRSYYDVRPMIIAEEYIEQADKQLYDYKFFCYHGKPELAYVAVDHFSPDGTIGEPSKISLYTLDWKRQDIRYGEHQQNDGPAPHRLDDMIEISKKLSKAFPYVRVDFFEVEDKLYLSELTFYPGGGFIQLPEEVQKQWGQLLRLPPKQKLGRKIRTDLM